MKFATRCLPIGSLPYDNIEAVSRMEIKLFEHFPFLPLLPKLDTEDTIAMRTLHNIPVLKVKGDKISLRGDIESNKKHLVKLDKAFNDPTPQHIEPYAIESVYMDKFLHLIEKSKAPQASVSLLGPFSISQKLMGLSSEQLLADKSFRKLFIQAVTVKALWIINKIKEVNSRTTPVIILEEPSLNQIGVVKKDNEEITLELITNLLGKVIEKIKAAGAIVTVHCMGKCDWTVPINAGADVISYDAYNNPNNLCIIPEQLKEFIANGGKVNWCIMPVMTESVVKNMNIDSLTQRLVKTMEGLVSAGVPPKHVYNSALVSIQGNVDKLPIIFAEKSLILASQLAKRIPVVG